MRPELQAVALGVLQGATELLPVSSSAHVAAVPWLLGWPARDKAFEVALHAGAAAALAPELLRALPGPRTLALSLAPPVIAGYLLERPIEERLSGPVPLAGGLIAGGLALAAADRAPEARRWTGRERGFGRPDASALSLGVAGPVLAGATALKVWRTRGALGREALAGGAAAFAAARAAVGVLG